MRDFSALVASDYEDPELDNSPTSDKDECENDGLLKILVNLENWN